MPYRAPTARPDAPPAPGWNEEKEAEFVRALAEGESIMRAGVRAGVSEHTARRKADAMGHRGRPKGAKGFPGLRTAYSGRFGARVS